jgi:cell division protein FtsI/penicillin-binding protein 2
MWRAFQYRRFVVAILVLAAGYAWLGCRLYRIQVSRHGELLAKAREYTNLDRPLAAWRGQIRDRDGRVLAISVPVGTLYADARLSAKHAERVARTCGPLLGMAPEQLARRLGSAGPGRTPKAIPLKRNVALLDWEVIRGALAVETFGLDETRLRPAEKAELNRLRHRLLFLREQHQRVYPYGECAARLVGFTASHTNGTGLKGVAGLERSLDPFLRGQAGRCVSERDAAGNELPLRRSLYQLPKDGQHVVLTVDLRVQQILEQSLAEGMANAKARRASAVVMDPRTFEVLGLACVPGFDPQHPGDGKDGSWRNPVLSDRVEPGSTFKLITLAAALDLGVLTLDSPVYCERGLFRQPGVWVRDHDSYGFLSLRECFAKSSNIAFAKVALLLGPQRLHRYIAGFGFGQRTGIPAPGETPGYIPAAESWAATELTRIAFGQGLAVSQLQMAMATCMVANGGRSLPVKLLRHVESPRGEVVWRPAAAHPRTVIRAATAHQLKEAMKAVVRRGGTGTAAALSRHTLAAKTGTAQKSDDKGYLAGCYYSSMIGFFPADDPRLVISVALDEPQNGYYAGEVVAPVFRAIAEQLAIALGIPPDAATPAPPAAAVDRHLARAEAAAGPRERRNAASAQVWPAAWGGSAAR